LVNLPSPKLTKSEKAWAVGLKGVSCTSRSDANGLALVGSSLLNEGTLSTSQGPVYGFESHCDTTQSDGSSCGNYVLGKCKQGQADEIIQFIAFGVSVVLLGLGFLLKRSGGRGGGRSGARYV
jgi:hypothetical protein